MREPNDRVVVEAQTVTLNIDPHLKNIRKASLVVTYIKETPTMASVIKVEGMPQDWYYAQLKPPRNSRLIKEVAKEFRRVTRFKPMYLADHFLLDGAIA